MLFRSSTKCKKRNRSVHISHACPVSTHLVEAEEGDLPANVDARGADAEHPLFRQPPLGIDGSRGDGGRQGGGNNYGHDIQDPDQPLPPLSLHKMDSIFSSIFILRNVLVCN